MNPFRILNEGNWEAPGNPTAFEDALRFFQKRMVMTDAEALKLGADASYQAFWIGGGLQVEAVGKVFDELEQALAAGESFEDFKKRVPGIFSSDAHAQTVFRNATQQSYASGRFWQMADPEVVAARPYWMHDSVLDSGTTHQCRTLHGKVFPIEHPHWRTHYPPGHHQCRRGIRNLTKRAAEKRGIETETPEGVTVPEGWGRLPPARPVWKPPKKKAKTKDRKKLAEELDKKKVEKDREKPKKAKPVPQPKAPKKAKPGKEPEKPIAPKPVSPLVAKAKEFERAILDQDWGKARDLVREHIEFARPGTVSKDVSQGLSAARSVTVGGTGESGGLHYWGDGKIAISDRTYGEVTAAARHLAAGTYHDPETYKLRGLERKMHYRGKDPLAPLSGLRTLLHEEIHGTSRIGMNYRGAAAVIEEAGVELNARIAMRSIGQQYADYVGPVTSNAIAAYDDFINDIVDILRESAPSLGPEKTHLMHFADAFQAGAMTEGAPFSSQEEYIGAITNKLPVPDSERAKVKARFLELQATHLSH